MWLAQHRSSLLFQSERVTMSGALLERPERQLREVPYHEFVERLRRPTPALFKLPVIVVTLLVEAWVHHEDLRHSETDAPRPTDARISAELWRAVMLLSRRR